MLCGAGLPFLGFIGKLQIDQLLSFKQKSFLRSCGMYVDNGCTEQAMLPQSSRQQSRLMYGGAAVTMRWTIDESTEQSIAAPVCTFQTYLIMQTRYPVALNTLRVRSFCWKERYSAMTKLPPCLVLQRFLPKRRGPVGRHVQTGCGSRRAP